MPSMVDQVTGDDRRLLPLAYIEFLLREDTEATGFLEQDSRKLARYMGGLAWFLMDAVVIPAEHGITWNEGWVSVDFRRRTDPDFQASLVRRNRYRRLTGGYTVRPKGRLRRTTRECCQMLCLAHTLEFGRRRVLPQRDATLEMVAFFRERFCQTSDAERNA